MYCVQKQAREDAYELKQVVSQSRIAVNTASSPSPARANLAETSFDEPAAMQHSTFLGNTSTPGRTQFPGVPPTGASVLVGTTQVGEMTGSIREIQRRHLADGRAHAREQHEAALPCPAETTFAVGQRHQTLNRYKNILPNDGTRVVLSGPDPLVNPATYINANTVEFPGVPRPSRYILFQAPLPHTINDTWRMLTEQRVELVVRAREGVRQRCGAASTARLPCARRAGWICAAPTF